jgi:hypothetical protein
MSIKEKLEKIKGMVDFEEGLERNSFVFAILTLVAVVSFGLGRLSGLEAVKREVAIEFPKNQQASAFLAAFATTAPETLFKTSGTYGASKNGTKYYLPSCGAWKRVSVKNQIWFDTKEEAEAAGYEPAANCPGI